MSVNWSELGVFISVCGSVLVSMCFAIQKSRCDKIKCCCMEIHRSIKEKTCTTTKTSFCVWKF